METNNRAGAKTITTAPPHEEAAPIRNIFLVAAIAAGVQFGWALQLSLLTPYVQLLGIPHRWASYIWLCGPISGMIVQPVVGYFSDNCTSRFGRRRPFIAAGAGLVAVAVFLIGFAADLGHAGGDPLGHGLKPRAIGVFVFGFWILDVANNMLQGPCRALLADLSGGNTKKMANANSFFSFFMAVGNVLGYAAGSYTKMYKVFPFSNTKACDVTCANLKSCFIISITLLITLTTLALSIVRETRHVAVEQVTAAKKGFKIPVFPELFAALKDLPKPMWVLLLVTALNWIAWFGFLLFDTDWMGREVYGGDPSEPAKAAIYNRGVSAGALGLMLNSIVLGFTSLGVQYMARALGGVKRLWGTVNFLLAVCLCMTVVISKVASHHRPMINGVLQNPESSVKIGALIMFSALGIPLAITFSVPFALASIYSNSTGAGQGLSLGVLNLAIVIPQMIVSVASGPWDDQFGGGNLPAFVVGAVAAFASGVFAFTMLPSPPADSIKNLSVSGGH